MLVCQDMATGDRIRLGRANRQMTIRTHSIPKVLIRDSGGDVRSHKKGNR